MNNYMYLRTKFKFATGYYPIKSKDESGAGKLRGDDVTNSYGDWLEHIFYDGNKERYLRSEFIKDTGEKVAVKHFKDNNSTWYTRYYILWLEEFILRSKLYQLD